MATLTSGAHGRTNQSGTSERSQPDIRDDAVFGKIKTVTIAADGTKLHLTGSDAGSSGFIVKTAGQGVITPTDGDAVSTGDFTTKTLYEIGVKQISGACTVHVIY